MNLEDYDIEKALLSISKGKWFKILHRWDFKKEYGKDKRPALVKTGGGCNIAIAGMRQPSNDIPEFYVALKIINVYAERLNGKA